MNSRRSLIMVGAGISFHHEVADRLQRIADKMSTPLHIVTTEDIKNLSITVNQPLEDILNLIENLHLPKTSSLGDDLNKLALEADYALQIDSLHHPIIDNDDRPWYEKASNKGGKKRKQNYNNRQPWKR